MLRVGCHLPNSRGLCCMARTALSIDANVFQFFSRNPRSSSFVEFMEDDINEFIETYLGKEISTIVAHAPYTINLCSFNHVVRDFSFRVLAEDMRRMEKFPGIYYNLHPGSHTGQGIDTGIEQLVEAINMAIFPDMKTTLLLETMSGRGSEIGSSFAEIKNIIDMLGENPKIGVCFDTCHVFDAGYDVTDVAKTLEEFDKIIGLEKLKVLHLNDSKNFCGSRKDRHEIIGSGEIGMEAFRKIVKNKFLCELPIILETPNNLSGYIREIRMLRRFAID
jgi:deoxyribonuclease-4